MLETTTDYSAVTNLLLERGKIDERAISICQEQAMVTGEDIGIVFIRNGFLRQSDWIDAVLKVHPERIYDDTVVVQSIPLKDLIRTKTVMVAETPDRLYGATMGSEYEVQSVIKETDPRPITFVPLNMEKLDDYMNDLLRQSSSDDDSLVDRLIRIALNQGVSDLHLIPQQKSYIILKRVHGIRVPMHQGSLDEYLVVVARIKDRSKIDMSERRVPQDGSFQVEHKKRMVDLRVATTPSVHGEVVVIRLLDPDAIKPDLSTLGISRVEEWRKGINRSNGLCLICGPTGSGKTTTLNSTMREVDRIGKAVYSIEDPVEYQSPFVGQVNVNTAVGLDFNRALRSFMRMDPDIIITGEIRDDETSRIAVKGAETGHNMVATLHSSSIRGAIDRLRDLGVAANELRYILRTVLVQRLVRVFCKECHGEGCTYCDHTGYGGRTIVSECAYFPDEDSVDALLRGEVSWPLMVEDAVGKYKEGLTSRDEIIRVFGPEGEDALRRLA